MEIVKCLSYEQVVCACLCVCMCACVHACMRACVCICVCASVCATLHMYVCVVYVVLCVHGRRAFACAGPTLWNKQPRNMRNNGNLPRFKKQRRFYFLRKQVLYNEHCILTNLLLYIHCIPVCICM